MPGENFFDFRARLHAKPTAAQAPGSETLSVSQLTRIIEAAIQKSVPAKVIVHGELSNVNLHRASGHLYFTLKDADACIDCVVWKSDFVRLKFEPEDGQQVLVTGGVQVYGVRGRYQLYAKSLEPVGKGALELAYRQLYAKLEKEGLFSPARKRAIPKYPMHVALVTSRDGAALQDMLKVFRRSPWIRCELIPVAVQGGAAAAQIAGALKSIAADSIDLAIVARGGGSIEDLWSFSEEAVARAIVASRVPVITGIGHEVDTSIADLVADHHAHTPTEAAQVAVTHWRTAREDLAMHGVRLARAVRAIVSDHSQRMELIARHESFRRPMDRLNHLRQRLDDRQRSLIAAMRDRLHRAERTLETRDARLRRHHPLHRLRLIDQILRASQTRLAGAIDAAIGGRITRLRSLETHLHAISPQAVLQRGYSITTLKRGGKTVRSTNDVRAGDSIITKLSDGQIESVVDDQHQQKLFD